MKELSVHYPGIRWVGHVARMGYMRNAYKIFGRKPEGKRPLGIFKRRWEGNIRMYLRERVWEVVDWIHLTQDRDQWAGSCEHCKALSGSIKGEGFLD
jgi:hypothetical protein